MAKLVWPCRVFSQPFTTREVAGTLRVPSAQGGERSGRHTECGCYFGRSPVNGYVFSGVHAHAHASVGMAPNFSREKQVT
jgi:hypothetical protein